MTGYSVNQTLQSSIFMCFSLICSLPIHSLVNTCFRVWNVWHLRIQDRQILSSQRVIINQKCWVGYSGVDRECPPSWTLVLCAPEIRLVHFEVNGFHFSVCFFFLPAGYLRGGCLFSLVILRLFSFGFCVQQFGLKTALLFSPINNYLMCIPWDVSKISYCFS